MEYNQRLQRWGLNLLLLAVVMVGFAPGTPWHNSFYNVLFRGHIQVGSNAAPGVSQTQGSIYATSTLEIDGASTFDGTVTSNSTLTASGAVELNGSNTKQLSWITNDNARSFTGWNLPDTSVIALFAPTNGVTVHSYEWYDADTLRVTLTNWVTADVSQSALAFPY